MAEYYLISQLPSLDGISDNTPLPIAEEQFFELCGRFLNKKTMQEMEDLTLSPSLEFKKSKSSLIEAWNKGERDLRLALAKARADKMNKPFNTENAPLPLELTRIANWAVELENPMEAEVFLSNYRLKFLETLRPLDNFSEDFLFYYALKLKLVMRTRKFETELGQNVYKNIYNSILNGDKLEAI